MQAAYVFAKILIDVYYILQDQYFVILYHIYKKIVSKKEVEFYKGIKILFIWIYTISYEIKKAFRINFESLQFMKMVCQKYVICFEASRGQDLNRIYLASTLLIISAVDDALIFTCF